MESSESRARPDVPLWRSRNFLTFWAGQAFSQFGAELAGLAIPVVAVLLLSASEWEVGLLGAAGHALAPAEDERTSRKLVP